MHDDVFLESVTAALSSVPGVRGVALGGSQARGVQRPDSDWDLAVYYRDALDVEQIRALGWRGELTELGGWESLFNGGGRVTVDGRDNRPLWGEVPQWGYPDALRTSASAEWSATADMTLVYAKGHARRGRVAQCAGLMSEAACRAGHAILAARGEWVTTRRGCSRRPVSTASTSWCSD